MGIAGVTMKIMPTSPEVDLKELGEKVKTLIESNEGKVKDISEEPIAFGLKALNFIFEWNEEKESDEIAEKAEQIEEVNSAQITDIRRLVQ